MAYQKTTWTNNVTKVNADNMNKIENELSLISPTGEIRMFAGSTAPTGFLICDGSEVSRTTYSDLFDVIGTTYGTGDGSTTFNLPNLKGKVVVGLDSSDTSFNSLGNTGGDKTVTLNINQIPPHKHNLYISGGTDVYSGLSYANGGTYNSNFIQETGGGQPHNNLQPYIVMNYIIRY